MAIFNLGDELKKRKRKKEGKIKPVIAATYPGLVDLVLDNEEAVAYLLRSGNGFEVAREIVSEDKIIIPPERQYLPFPLVRLADLQLHGDGPDPHLFHDVIDYFRRFAYLPEDALRILSLYTFMTYLQDSEDLFYMPMLLFWAVPERGKTRTGRVLLTICYRGIHCVDLREANLFRYSENLRATLFMDVMDLWKKAQKSGSEDILLLRYERGAKVARVLYPEKGAFEDTRYYRVDGPTLIATNEPLHHILDTRCLCIEMVNRPGIYEDPTPEKGRALKARLTAWRARHMYEPLPEVEPVSGISGRLWDITKPLLQIAKIVAREHYQEIVEYILKIARQRSSDKRESLEGKILTVIHDLSRDALDNGLQRWELATSDVLDGFNLDMPEGFRKSAHWIGRRIRALGLTTSTATGRSKIFLERGPFEILLEQYGIVQDPSPFGSKSDKSDESNYDGISNSCWPDFQKTKSDGPSKSRDAMISVGYEEAIDIM